MRAQDVIAALGLAAHPEGGWYRETFRDTRLLDGRPASTAIYYLLDVGELSDWHRVTPWRPGIGTPADRW